MSPPWLKCCSRVANAGLTTRLAHASAVAWCSWVFRATSASRLLLPAQPLQCAEPRLRRVRHVPSRCYAIGVNADHADYPADPSAVMTRSWPRMRLEASPVKPSTSRPAGSRTAQGAARRRYDYEGQNVGDGSYRVRIAWDVCRRENGRRSSRSRWLQILGRVFKPDCGVPCDSESHLRAAILSFASCCMSLPASVRRSSESVSLTSSQPDAPRALRGTAGRWPRRAGRWPETTAPTPCR